MAFYRSLTRASKRKVKRAYVTWSLKQQADRPAEAERLANTAPEANGTLALPPCERANRRDRRHCFDSGMPSAALDDDRLHWCLQLLQASKGAYELWLRGGTSSCRCVSPSHRLHQQPIIIFGYRS